MRKFILIVILLIVATPFISMIYENLTGIAVYLEDGTKIGRLEITPYDTMEIDLGTIKTQLAISNMKLHTNLADVFDNYDLTCDYFSIYDQDTAFLGNIDRIEKFKPKAGYVYTWTNLKTKKSVFVNPSYAILGTVKKRPKGDNSARIDSTKEEKKKLFLNQLFGGK